MRRFKLESRVISRHHPFLITWPEPWEPLLVCRLPSRNVTTFLRCASLLISWSLTCSARKKSSQEGSLAAGVLNFAVVFMVSGMRTGRASRLRKASVF
ncbi:hypothetical protein DTO063F5_351 [Paecilomyces variotii]|nr:hypothetical protein DTO063F5_351 [Paecilomyces variotii]